MEEKQLGDLDASQRLSKLGFFSHSDTRGNQSLLLCSVL